MTPVTFSGEEKATSSFVRLPERPEYLSRRDLVQDKKETEEEPEPKVDITTTITSEKKIVEKQQRQVNRCSGCRKKVGLTGFRCRCGDMYCSEHRYSDRHDCSFDYKAAGRDTIARENPVVKAAKIIRL